MSKLILKKTSLLQTIRGRKLKYGIMSKIYDSLYFFRIAFNLVSEIKKTETVRHQAITPSGDVFRTKVSNVFKNHGSDKSTHHDYHEVYADIINEPSIPIKKVLEIGIGSNDISTPQNMGVNGVPGAALRAFLELLPESMVFGADIDPKALINEANIKSVVVDQLDPNTFEKLKNFTGDSIDLLVIDGLHTPRADINSLALMYDSVSKSGYIIIEDIAPKAAKFLWPALIFPLSKFLNVRLLNRKNGFLLVLQK
jgi:hypothetical protein